MTGSGLGFFWVEHVSIKTHLGRFFSVVLDFVGCENQRGVLLYRFCFLGQLGFAELQLGMNINKHASSQ